MDQALLTRGIEVRHLPHRFEVRLPDGTVHVVWRRDVLELQLEQLIASNPRDWLDKLVVINDRDDVAQAALRQSWLARENPVLTEPHRYFPVLWDGTRRLQVGAVVHVQIAPEKVAFRRAVDMARQQLRFCREKAIALRALEILSENPSPRELTEE